MEKHYICLGGCKGVSETPGVCQTLDCANHKHELVPCECADGRHCDFAEERCNESSNKIGNNLNE